MRRLCTRNEPGGVIASSQASLPVSGSRAQKCLPVPVEIDSNLNSFPPLYSAKN